MASVQKISPCLWFDGNGEEAAEFYCSVFEDSGIDAIARYGEAGPGEPGSVMIVDFHLAGQDFLALNGGPAFKFTEAVSLMVRCADQAEIDRMWEKLVEGGGRHDICGWLKDRFGLSWQIVPADVADYYPVDDPVRSARVLSAVMGMTKLDIAAMDSAFHGH